MKMSNIKLRHSRRALTGIIIASIIAQPIPAFSLGGHENFQVEKNGRRYERNPILDTTYPSAPWGTAEELGWFFPKGTGNGQLDYSRYGFGEGSGDPWDNISYSENNDRRVIIEQSLREFLGTEGTPRDWIERSENGDSRSTRFIRDFTYDLLGYSPEEINEKRLSEAERIAREYEKFFVMTAAILADIEKNNGISAELKDALKEHGYNGDLLAGFLKDIYGHQVYDTRQDNPVIIDGPHGDKIEVPTTADVMVLTLSSFHLASLYSSWGSAGVDFSSNSDDQFFPEWTNHLDNWEDRDELKIWDVFDRWDQGEGFDESLISEFTQKFGYSPFRFTWLDRSSVMQITDLVEAKYNDSEQAEEKINQVTADLMELGRAIWGLSQSISDEEMDKYNLVFKTYGSKWDDDDFNAHCSELDITNSVVPVFEKPKDTPTSEPSPTETPTPKDTPTSEPSPTETPTPKDTPTSEPSPIETPTPSSPEVPQESSSSEVTTIIWSEQTTSNTPTLKTPTVFITDPTPTDSVFSPSETIDIDIPSAQNPVPPVHNTAIIPNDPVVRTPQSPIIMQENSTPVSQDEIGPIVDTGGAVNKSIWIKISNLFK